MAPKKKKPKKSRKRAKERGRWTSKAKMEIVLRILKGEAIDEVSREINVTAARIAQWRDDFLVGGEANLKRRKADARDEEISLLRQKVGELTMENELLNDKVDRMEQNCPPLWRRSRR